ncbi:AbrB/MazE/SpoVT family DNA-binding domain-containing protein [Mesorhizobium sp. Z1-4]|uniref:AbrB/MazE/SpoVT family DNA-binding domain-containing protein n=1 Tax=Mesorhizobium sp. Z1-4 TaxID=2448478 RepID=UPI000FDA9158|nr:AbrB/MazE/SpoVT family DNA-binding domain-containing protein [Mesorhizobium sp. Z1-4]
MGIESKLTAKGQTTVPIEVREYLGLGPGDHVRYVLIGDRVELVPRNRPVSSIFGLLADFGVQGTSIEDYKEAVADAVADREAQRAGKPGKDAA